MKAEEERIAAYRLQKVAEVNKEMDSMREREKMHVVSGLSEYESKEKVKTSLSLILLFSLPLTALCVKERIHAVADAERRRLQQQQQQQQQQEKLREQQMLQQQLQLQQQQLQQLQPQLQPPQPEQQARSKAAPVRDSTTLSDFSNYAVADVASWCLRTGLVRSLPLQLRCSDCSAHLLTAD